MSNQNKALDHLIQVIGLAGLPREQWTAQDWQSLREAREFVQQHRKDISESKREEASGDSAGRARQPQGGEETEGGVREEGVPLEAGAQDSLSAQSEEE